MIRILKSKVISDFDFFKPDTITSYINLYNYQHLRKNKEIVEGIDRFTLDGIAMVRLFNFFGLKTKRRSPDFSSYFSELFTEAEKTGKRLFIVGGSQEELGKFKEIISRKYPDLIVKGGVDGYFQNDETSVRIHKVVESGADFVILGMGTPKQEEFAIDLKKSGFSGSIYTCGAFISQTAMTGFDYYPQWMNKLNMRWAYRIFKEKKHMKRYFLLYPLSLWYLSIDYFKKI